MTMYILEKQFECCQINTNNTIAIKITKQINKQKNNLIIIRLIYKI